MILDKHESHLSTEVLDFAKDNGVIMLSFPPHCSHILKPLDLTVFGPFKKFYNNAVKGWLSDNSGKPVGIYNIPSFVASAFPKAMTPENTVSGFRVTFFPHNRDIFLKETFLPSSVTGRQDPHTTASTADNVDCANTAYVSPPVDSSASTVTSSAIDSTNAEPIGVQDMQSISDGSSQSDENINSPPSIPENNPTAESYQLEGKRPYPSAREAHLHGRSGRMRILTDTPVKNELTRREQKKQRTKKCLRYKETDKYKWVQTTVNCLRRKLKDEESQPTRRNKSKKQKSSSDAENRSVLSSEDESNPLCLFCSGRYLNCRKLYRAWIQCQYCLKWAQCLCREG